MQPTRHVPVLAAEVVRELSPQPGQIVVDATVGGGGHSTLLAQRLGSTGHLIALDRDPGALDKARNRLAPLDPLPKVSWVHANFDRLRSVLDDLGVSQVDAVLADLGFSSDQIEAPQRGLSFQLEGPLDMRLDPREEQTAADIVASWNERDLADLFWHLGEERYSRRIARAIVKRRTEKPLNTTLELADLIRSCVPRSPRGIDPATRSFQALRIAVNDELGSLKRFIDVLPSCLKAGGLAAIISFHSLEDRIVKQAFREKELWEQLTRKPIEATDEEVAANPRARSAKLRVGRLIQR